MSAWPDFPVPTDWRVLETRQIAERMRAGGTPSRKVEKYWDGDIPFVLIEDMTSMGLYLDRTKERITPAGLENSSTWLVPSGSVLLSMYATIGATAINRIPVATNQAILAIIPTKDHWPEFLVFCLRAHKEALSARNIQATQKNINKGIVETFPLPLPPFAEQQKIAGVLGLVQRAMEQQERLIEKTAELKKTLLHQLFTQGTRGEPQKQTDLGPVPESWEVGKIGDVAKTQSGGTPARDKPEYWNDGTIPWVKTGEIDYCVIEKTEEHITAKGLADSAAKLFPKGTLLMAMYGQGVTRGRVALLGIDATTNQACAAIIPRSEKQVSSRYLYSYLEYHYENLRKLGHGANQKNMNAALIRGFPLAFPKPDEQSDIVTALSSVDSKLTHHRRKHATLSALFRTLLHQLMTAQLRVHDLDLPELGTDTPPAGQIRTFPNQDPTLTKKSVVQ